MPNHSHAAPSNPHADAAVGWLDWSPEAFERAARERKAVLLAIGASWCHGCAVMDRTTYAMPELVAAINDRVVPVKVDADRRPDINERYNLEGWPTTAFLTPSGEVLTGSTYVTPELMVRMLAEVTDGLAARYDELMARADAAAAARRRGHMPMRYEPDLGAPPWLVEQILAQHDPEHGGFGAGGKFLHAAPLRLALAAHADTADARLEALLRTTLDAMVSSAICDQVDGGFFRYAANRDWSRPHTEKMLEDQAAMIALLLDASVVLDRPLYAERAAEAMRYVVRTLADSRRGGFFASQRADDDYYAVAGSIRRTLEPPVVDTTLFTDTNAQAAVAWLHAATVTGDTAAAQAAVQAMERVLLATYQPGHGVAHHDGGIRGLLTDQVHAAWALLHLHDATGNDTYSMLAEELMRTAMRTMWDASHGGFLDHAPGDHDIGLLREPVRPLGLNSLACRALLRLEALTGADDLRQYAREALASQTGVYRAQGISAAPYGLAALDLAD